MSQSSKSISEQVEELDLSTEKLREVYHIPLLTLLVAFSLWVRTRGWQKYTSGDQILFSGNDPWYHYRMIQYTVDHWPAAMPFDPWTGFPVGKNPSTFGTLFDQLVATAALIYGLGSPTAEQVKLVTLFAPAVMGALALIPLYVIGKRFGGKAGGLIATLVGVVTPGLFLTRGLVGVADHQVAEVLFMGIAVALLLIALDVAKRDRPIWELFTAGDLDALRPTLVWSALAGLGLGLYVWVWPPGVVLVGIVNLFLVLYLLGTFIRGGVPDHVGIVGVVALGVTMLLSIIQMESLELSIDFSLTQPLVAGLGIIACIAIVAGSRAWESMDRDLPRWQFGVGLLVLGLVAVGLAALLVPDVVGYFQRQVVRVFGTSVTDTASTIGEVTPSGDPIGFFFQSFGFAFFTGIAGLVALTYRSLQDDAIAPAGLFVVVWSLFLFAMANTMTRFAVYMVLPLGALNAFLAKEVFELLGLYDLSDLTDIEGYQVISVVAALLLVTAPLAVTVSQGGFSNAALDTAEARGSGSPSAAQWEPGLEWLQDETPEEGQWGENPETGLDEGYYGTYSRTDDFEYGSGDYGVLAWWDYGHWITVLGERIPNANPFQQNANYAANIMLSANESYTVEATADTGGAGEQTRYVMLDYQMGLAGTAKFGAPTAFQRRYAYDTTNREFVVQEYGEDNEIDQEGLRGMRSSDLQQSLFVVQQTRGSSQLVGRYGVHSQRSMESLRTRLYQFHGSRAEPTFQDGSVVVADWSRVDYRGTTIPGITASTQPVRTFPNMSAAEQFVRRDGTAQVGGVLGKPSEPVPALEHYRLVWASQRTAQTPISRAFTLWSRLNERAARPIETQPYLKTFERVEGATIEGEGPANSNVTATVRMRIPTNGRTFTYTQEAETGPNGEFTMTVPYSTTGYDQFGPEEGRTNVSVRATGPYRFTAPTVETDESITRYGTNVTVSEAKVIGRDDEPVTVTMEGDVVNEPADNDTNSTSTPTDGTNSTDSGGSDTNSTSSTPTPTGTSTPTATPAATPTATPSESLAPPAWLTTPLAALR
ncbi:oligosaccharyl transferase, archaeosortase A system-associated [Haloglomus litoreum]|uniref:oligosaccharyl transferase, archaeosortase A system-associated n=1 Tax=Haloglomus litoreum TaxID=3034026 RepID=UPI0023E7A815|nr:oligosaccharyl transferase, archaeosortase A system-associated [Haloglomus sp. DT116]